jgi:hypothetical protein
MDESLKDYRSRLEVLEQKAQEDFDKTVLSLSGGALGISFAFVKDIVGSAITTNPLLLFLSWLCWGLSVMFVLISYYTSHLALRKAIKQVDTGKIRVSQPGGIADLVTALCNALGGILFIVGVVLISTFVWLNLG